MPEQEILKGLCYDERGEVKTKNECRASMINYLILEDTLDIDEAEDLAEKTLNDLDLWPEPTEDKNQDVPGLPLKD
ncbi:MAG: hypothetical protein P1P90_04990 [Patescibacteria group bacterium]|nr:hypothetical protein [Patescibacteria group bacterium]